jgi:hypothetical protein
LDYNVHTSADELFIHPRVMNPFPMSADLFKKGQIMAPELVEEIKMYMGLVGGCAAATRIVSVGNGTIFFVIPFAWNWQLH